MNVSNDLLLLIGTAMIWQAQAIRLAKTCLEFCALMPCPTVGCVPFLSKFCDPAQREKFPRWRSAVANLGLELLLAELGGGEAAHDAICKIVGMRRLWHFWSLEHEDR
jgi:hypothetical protein